MAETESVVEPDRVTDDIGWEPVPFVNILPLILSIQRVNLAIPRHLFLCFRFELALSANVSETLDTD